MYNSIVYTQIFLIKVSISLGRPASETYDTSNSSVSSQSTSHSNHSGRLNSTASNCSGDSGTQVDSLLMTVVA